jgi:hypothetical protein
MGWVVLVCVASGCSKQKVAPVPEEVRPVGVAREEPPSGFVPVKALAVAPVRLEELVERPVDEDVSAEEEEPVAEIAPEEPLAPATRSIPVGPCSAQVQALADDPEKARKDFSMDIPEEMAPFITRPDYSGCGARVLVTPPGRE